LCYSINRSSSFGNKRNSRQFWITFYTSSSTPTYRYQFIIVTDAKYCNNTYLIYLYEYYTSPYIILYYNNYYTIIGLILLCCVQVTTVQSHLERINCVLLFCLVQFYFIQFYYIFFFRLFILFVITNYCLFNILDFNLFYSDRKS